MAGPAVIRVEAPKLGLFESGWVGTARQLGVGVQGRSLGGLCPSAGLAIQGLSRSEGET